MRARLLRGPVGALALIAGCASGAALDGDADTDASATPPSDGDSSATADTAMQDTGPPAVPTWWSVDGTLVVAAGVPDLATSEITVGLYDAELTPLCASERALSEAVAAYEAEDAVHAFWSVTLADGEGCAPAIPTAFSIGIGGYDRQLDPALAEAELDSAALFGLYLQYGARPLYVVGIAGTAEQLAGTPASSPPLPDGTYTLDGLHLLPL